MGSNNTILTPGDGRPRCANPASLDNQKHDRRFSGRHGAVEDGISAMLIIEGCGNVCGVRQRRQSQLRQPIPICGGGNNLEPLALGAGKRGLSSHSSMAVSTPVGRIIKEDTTTWRRCK